MDIQKYITKRAYNERSLAIMSLNANKCHLKCLSLLWYSLSVHIYALVFLSWCIVYRCSTWLLPFIFASVFFLFISCACHNSPSSQIIQQPSYIFHFPLLFCNFPKKRGKFLCPSHFSVFFSCFGPFFWLANECGYVSLTFKSHGIANGT